MREEHDPCACTHTIAKWHVFGGNRIGALTLGTLAPGPRGGGAGIWVPALGFLFHTTYVNVVRRSPRLRRVWAVELNLSLSVDSPGAPLNVPTNARKRLGHPDSDACSSLGFRV